MCELTSDLAILPSGDATEIGERYFLSIIFLYCFPFFFLERYLLTQNKNQQLQILICYVINFIAFLFIYFATFFCAKKKEMGIRDFILQNLAFMAVEFLAR